ncbi:MAG: hypothetical protein IPN18_18245 [Ignavibacteriales bacterium]|jgi:hypothetical protein|nr:hypothetical protein [Ignavibacteriales bacterium]
MKHYNDEFFNKMIDGEVDDSTRREFLHHISECKNCELEYLLLQKAHNSFQKIQIEEAPPTLNMMVLKRISRVVKPSEGGKKFFIGMLIGLTTMLLVLFGYAFEVGKTLDPKDQKPLIDFSKFDLSFLQEFLNSFKSFSAVFTPEFGGTLILLAVSIGTYFFVERVKTK